MGAGLIGSEPIVNPDFNFLFLGGQFISKIAKISETHTTCSLTFHQMHKNINVLEKEDLHFHTKNSNILNTQNLNIYHIIYSKCLKNCF